VVDLRIKAEDDLTGILGEPAAIIAEPVLINEEPTISEPRTRSCRLATPSAKDSGLVPAGVRLLASKGRSILSIVRN
jgi:hypothetical protein